MIAAPSAGGGGGGGAGSGVTAIQLPFMDLARSELVVTFVASADNGQVRPRNRATSI
jgi:hypothetical protein